jgi:Siphovirus Gp157
MDVTVIETIEQEKEKKSLVDLEKEFRDIVYQIQEMGGELTPEAEKELDASFEALCAKTDGYGIVHERLKAEIDFWKIQKDSCAKAESVFKNALESLRNRMKFVLENREDKSLQGNFFRFFLAKGADRLEVVDELLPREFMIAKVIVSPDTDAIKKALKEGKEVPGAKMIGNNFSLRMGKPKA